MSQPKRRRLPDTFRPGADEELRACLRVQRFWRWRRALAAQVDPVLQTPVRAGDAVRLVEPCGFEHWYNSSGLARYFLSSAAFLNPLSRRELHRWEVMRVVARQPGRLRPLLVATFLARHALRRAAHDLEGTDAADVLQGGLDERLEALLRSGEKYLFAYDVALSAVQVENYADDLLELSFLDCAAAKQLCRRHAEVAAHRGVLCPLDLAEELKLVHGRCLRRSEAPRAQEPPVLLLDALLRRLQFS